MSVLKRIKILKGGVLYYVVFLGAIEVERIYLDFFDDVFNPFFSYECSD